MPGVAIFGPFPFFIGVQWKTSLCSLLQGATMLSSRPYSSMLACFFFSAFPRCKLRSGAVGGSLGAPKSGSLRAPESGSLGTPKSDAHRDIRDT